jgi:signal transduction histidine kinase
VEIELELEPLPEVSARGGELGQVVMNLLLNSSQAMPAGGHVRIIARETTSSIEVRVEDDGPGVPADIRDAIFDPFFTTRPPNEGTGLGLSICHQIIHRHGGDLRLEPGGPGATFVISLPKIAPECPATHTSASS